MRQLLKILIVTVLFFGPAVLFGQDNVEYKNEEIKVINQFLYKLIDAERLSKFNQTDKPQILYFHTSLGCNLNKVFHDNYKPNNLLKKLENYNIKVRIIDSIKIKKTKGVKIIFSCERMYSVENYASSRVIGTVSFSRISFNKSLTLGYFYYDVYCGEDCGWGDLIKIEKRNGTWEIVEYLSSWIS